jgi:hypothetical protein
MTQTNFFNINGRNSIISIDDDKKSINSYYPGSLCRRLSRGRDNTSNCERENIFGSLSRKSCLIPRVVKASHHHHQNNNDNKDFINE